MFAKVKCIVLVVSVSQCVHLNPVNKMPRDKPLSLNASYSQIQYIMLGMTEMSRVEGWWFNVTKY